MNKCLIQINDNYGAVSDENGNVKVVRKENNEVSFEDILTKENELSSLNEQLKDDKEELDINKNNMIYAEIFNLTIYGGTTALYFATEGKLTPVGTVLLLGTFYATFKGVACLMTGGTRIGRIKRRKQIKNDIESLEQTIPTAEKELNDAKEKIHYQDNVTAVQENAPYKQIVNAMDTLSNKDEIKSTLKSSNPRILRLVKSTE